MSVYLQVHVCWCLCPTQIFQISQNRIGQMHWLSRECCNTQVHKGSVSTGWHCYEFGGVFFFCFLQSWGNNQLMCGILCQKWGNINFFAPGNLNISRKDINTIATPTHTHTITHMGFINLLCNRTLSSGFNITVNGDAYLQAVLPLK